MSKNIFYLIAALLIIFLVGGVIFFFTQQRQEERGVPSLLPVQAPQEQEQEGLGSQLYENPAEKVPETNPFEAETNPFEGYRNPFE